MAANWTQLAGLIRDVLIKIFSVDFLVSIDFNCFAHLILKSDVDLREYIAVTNEDVAADEVVADGLEGHVKPNADDESALE